MARSDEELMRRTEGGDLAAFGELFDRHQPALYRFFCRFLGDAGTAEDMAQEVLWRVWQHRADFDGGRPFGPWLYGIARHLALNEAKKPYRRAASFSELPPALQEHLQRRAGAGGAETGLENLALREQVRAALQALPPDQRLCILLREYEGMSHREIAAVMGVSEGNARVLAHRARRALQALLQSLVESEGLCV